MSLIQCPTCKKNVSSEAVSCPGCGHPIKTSINCPNCQSSNVNKISAASKAGSALMFGVFSLGKLSKTYECKKCGYKW